MKNLISKLYEHLKTRRKYNTLLLKYEIVKEEKEEMKEQRDTQKRIYEIRKETWEKALKEQEEEIIRLKKRKK